MGSWVKPSPLLVGQTCIVNDSDPLYMHTTMARHGNSELKCSRLYNPKGSLNKIMVYSKLFKDGAVRPNEFKTYCEQCHEYHLVHTQESQKILYVTENWELANGSKSLSGELQDSSFKDLLLKAGITASEMVHIKFIDV